jgi:hypothetical protein
MIDRFNGLRCRPGDLAVITQDVPECQANIGQIVRVIAEYTFFPDELGFHWLVKPQSSQPSPVLVGNPGTPCTVVYDNGNRAHYDGWLRPLLYSQPPEEMTLLASVPSKTTASEFAPVHETRILNCKLTA